MDHGYLRERTCPICKKVFVPAPQHAWKTTPTGKLVCSYHCALEYDRRKAEKRKYTKLTKRSKGQ